MFKNLINTINIDKEQERSTLWHTRRLRINYRPSILKINPTNLPCNKKSEQVNRGLPIPKTLKCSNQMIVVYSIKNFLKIEEYYVNLGFIMK